MRRKGTARKRKPGAGRQRGGIAPFLAAAIPALVAGRKAVALVGLGAAANYGTIKTLKFLEKKKYKRRAHLSDEQKHHDGTHDQAKSLFK